MLVPVVTEMQDRLTGSRLGDVVQIDSLQFALRFDDPPFHRVGIILRPELCALHFVRRAPTPSEPTGLSVALTEMLGGLPLRSIRKEPEGRVVELEFGDGWSPGRFLILELLDRAANLLLLDDERSILRCLRASKGAPRRLEEGAPYAPPPPRKPDEAFPLGSRLLRREIEFRARRGEALERAREEILERMAAAAWEPVLYAPAPPETLGERDDLPPSALFAAPFPLACGEGLHATPFDAPSGAVEAHARLVRRHLQYRDLRSTLVAMLARERRRLERLDATLAAEAMGAAASGETRRHGELLMASISTAKKERDSVEVTDYFQPEMPRVRIPVDPSLDLKGNAERLFRKARKQERGVIAIAARRAETGGKLEGARGFTAELESAGSVEVLRDIETRLNRSGLVRAVRRPGRRKPGEKQRYMKVQEHRTSDGFVVLVGRGASDNDTLTFKVAGPNDFWLHAAGRSGAHVVVRNPRRMKELPPKALEEAAAIAAWYSRGDRETEVEVHVTKRKEVRKGKGMSPGMVTLRAWRSVRVMPAPPAGGRPGRAGTTEGEPDEA